MVDGMSALISNLTPVVTAIVGWVGDVATLITEEPILLMTTGFLVLGGAVGMFGRLLSRN